MRYLVVLSTVAIALIASAVAGAGGWATVGLDPLPAGLGPGDTWNTKMTVLQHGRTPLTGLSPTITITDDAGKAREFAATETSEPGVYAVSVVFPEAGSWRIVADSTFGDSKLTYGPVEIEPTSSVGAGDSSEFPVVPVLVAIVSGLALAALATFGVLRQRRLTPAG
jgi:hypothetical protein